MRPRWGRFACGECRRICEVSRLERLGSVPLPGTRVRTVPIVHDCECGARWACALRAGRIVARVHAHDGVTDEQLRRTLLRALIPRLAFEAFPDDLPARRTFIESRRALLDAEAARA